MSSFIRVRDKKTGNIVEIPIAIVGKSAYEIALSYGFEGTESEWLDSLKGEKGDGGIKDIPQVFLPSVAVAAVGVEFNIYWANVIRSTLSIDHYWIMGKMSGGGTYYNYDECFRFTPAAAGTYTITVTVHDIKTYQPIQIADYNGNIVSSIQITLTVVDKSIPSCTGLYIGDSLGYAYGAITAATLKYDLSSNSIGWIGTQTGSRDANELGDVNHEAYNGASINNSQSGDAARGFLTSKLSSSVTNPFWNADKQSFDLDYYMSQNGFTELDFIVLALGHNQINNGSTISYFHEIINLIRASSFGKDIPIFVTLITGVRSKDGWRSIADGVIYQRGWWNLIQQMLSAFNNEAVSNVYLTTQYWACDPNRMFPTENVARSARDTEIIVRQKDAMHPNKIGYRQIADAMYPYIVQAINNQNIPTYSVTNNLTNVVNSNPATNVREGSSYTASLTAASGYVLSTVTVTMGGDTVTATDGVINIPAVTGDIIITATSIKGAMEPEDTNLVDPSTANDSSPNTELFADEWLNDHYITYSNGLSIVSSSGSGRIVTDLIPVTYGKQLKIEGVKLDDATSIDKFRWIYFNSSGDTIYDSYHTPSNGDGAVCWDNENHILDTSKLGSMFNTLAYIRFCCYPAVSNENIIVTEI